MSDLLEIRHLSVEFDAGAGPVYAVNQLSYRLQQGETLGIVGESGSGKSAHALAILGLLPAPVARITSGEVLFNGRNLLALTKAELADIRGKEIGFVFQDPMTSLNPVLTIERQITESLTRHLRLSRRAARDRAVELLDQVGIVNPRQRLQQYPHQFSGGMRQRVMIAIAIACEPKLLIADEATTALDVTVQAQILQLIGELKEKTGMSVIWITHDMAVVARLANTLQVMYGGRILERGPTSALFRAPHNAYTLGLLKSLPGQAADRAGRLYQIPGSPPDPRHLPPGDPFAPRNPYATDRCRQEMPPLRQVANGVAGHQVAAWYDLPTLLATDAARAAGGQ